MLIRTALSVNVTGEHTDIFLVVHDSDHTSCDDCLGHLKFRFAYIDVHCWNNFMVVQLYSLSIVGIFFYRTF